MNVLRLAGGVMAMLAGVIVAGYALGWMVKRLAQFIAGGIALVSGALIFLVGATFVLDELEDNKELAKAAKSARKFLRSRGVSDVMKSAQKRRRQLRREAGKLWD